MAGFYAGLRHQPDSSQAQHETYIDGLLGKVEDHVLEIYASDVLSLNLLKSSSSTRGYALAHDLEHDIRETPS